MLDDRTISLSFLSDIANKPSIMIKQLGRLSILSHQTTFNYLAFSFLTLKVIFVYEEFQSNLSLSPDWIKCLPV